MTPKPSVLCSSIALTWLLTACSPFVKCAVAPSQIPPTEPTVATAPVKVNEAKDNKYPLIIAAIIHVESKGNPRAVSRRGAKGLMQLMPHVIRKYGVKRPFNPEENVKAGTRLFEEELQRFDGNVSLALAAYNAGSPRVQRAVKLARSTNFFHVRHFLPQETRMYVPRVFEVFNQLQSDGVYAFNTSQKVMLGEMNI